jgi:hypothetical protein
MRTAPAVVSLLLVAISFAGCLDAITEELQGGVRAQTDQFLAGPALWKDPQNAPHPMFNWPTLSSPATGPGLPEFWDPIPAAKLPNPIKGIDLLSKRPDGVRSGAGISIFGSLLIVPGFSQESYIVDIHDPAHPALLSTIKGAHRGSATIAYPDGRLVAVFSTDSGIEAWDITDSRAPDALVSIKPKQGGHKLGVIPGTPIVYNAASCGGSNLPACAPGPGQTTQTAKGLTEIYDFTDPENPQLVKEWQNGFSCHHVYFWNDAANQKYRGLCAGIEYTQLWDTKDPKDPKVIVNVPVHHGVANTPSGSVFLEAFSHYAGLSNDGKILIVGDENGGGSVPPGCGASASTPAGAASTPVGAIWFYDVSNEKDPKLLGWYSPLNDPRLKASPITSCTAHHGRIVPAEGRNMLAMSFYGAGVVLVDFTGVNFAAGKLPVVVDQYASGSDTWETWYDQGYLVTGDLARGMDVLKFE